MALISLNPDFGDAGDFRGAFQAEYTRRYVGISNNVFDTPVSIARDRRTPKPGQRDPFDFRAFVTAVHCERRPRTLTVWDVDVTSSTEFDEEQIENPLNQPAEIIPSSDQYVEPTWWDARGNLATTTSGTPIPIDREDSRWVFDVEKNVARIPDWLMEMNNTINSGVVFLKGLLIPRRTLMVKGIRGGREQSRRLGATGIRVTWIPLQFQLHYRREGWRVPYPNVDRTQLVPEVRSIVRNGRTLAPEFDADGRVRYRPARFARRRIEIAGEPVTEPWPLDARGRALPEGYDPREIITLHAEMYREAPFDLLPLT